MAERRAFFFGMIAKPINFAESEQPALFAPEQLPDAQALETAVKEYCHTGKIATKDHQRAEMVLTHYLQSGSLRATASVMGCSPRTIHRMLEAFAASGKLAALKERLSHRLGLILELSADDMVDKAERGELKLSPIDYAVLLDKRLLLGGQATSITEQHVAVEVRLDDVIGYLASKGIAVPALGEAASEVIDVESTVQAPNSKEIAP